MDAFLNDYGGRLAFFGLAVGFALLLLSGFGRGWQWFSSWRKSQVPLDPRPEPITRTPERLRSSAAEYAVWYAAKFPSGTVDADFLWACIRDGVDYRDALASRLESACVTKAKTWDEIHEEQVPITITGAIS